MNFRTEFNFPTAGFKINHADKLLLVGSCFSDNIGNKLRHSGFDLSINPLGISFNPISIGQGLRMVMQQKVMTKSDLFFHQDLWRANQFHSSFSSTNEDEILTKMNSSLSIAYKNLLDTSIVFVTFGSAFYYELISTGEVVANCHKLPSDQFIKKRLRVHEIVDDYSQLIKEVRVLNPKIKIVFTLSPVRHLKDGFIENQLSKSILHQAIQELILMQDRTYYFPSYEIVMDDLRDYRFYADDLLHPNELAINYIFEKFCSHYCTAETLKKSREVEQFFTDRAHRVLHPSTQSHLKFQQVLKLKENDLVKELPHLANYLY